MKTIGGGSTCRARLADTTGPRAAFMYRKPCPWADGPPILPGGMVAAIRRANGRDPLSYAFGAACSLFPCSVLRIGRTLVLTLEHFAQSNPEIRLNGALAEADLGTFLGDAVRLKRATPRICQSAAARPSLWRTVSMLIGNRRR
jgi:hypothetical protein